MSVFLNNLDDFIAPSQACINPFVLNKKTDAVKSANAKITLQSDFSSTEFEKPRKPDLIKLKVSTAFKGQKVAAVSLNDCLACSGCVTSAETVLIQEQSYHRLYERINNRTHSDVIVVCLSPQSVASMATFIGTSSNDMFLRIASVLKTLGVQYVFDTSSAGDVALIESREEFLMRYRNGKNFLWKKPPHTVAASCSSVFLIPEKAGSGHNSGNKSSDVSSSLFGANLNDLLSARSSSNGSAASVSMSMSSDENGFGNDILDVGAPINGDQTLPMLASQCPGWVCYAEKTQPQSLPYISHTKSAQQIIGAIAKHLIFKQQPSGATEAPSSSSNSSSSFSSSFGSTSLSPSSSSASSAARSVYIVSVQPCFDKKLESSRKDFYHADTDTQEVDLVISTTELWNMIEEQAAASGTQSTSAAAAAESIPSSSSAATTPSSPPVAPAASVSAAEYLLNITPDSPHGRDDIERLFRSYSTDGLALVTAADANNSSGGYLEHLFRHAAEKLGGVSLWGQPLQYTAGRNIDVCEVNLSEQVHSSTGTFNGPSSNGLSSSETSSLSSSSSSEMRSEGKTEGKSKVIVEGEAGSQSGLKLKFGKAYGFRNIQSVMLKMKQGKCDLDFVEIMACPSGCVNGGGQLKEQVIGVGGDVVRESISATGVRVRAVEDTYHRVALRRVEDSPLVRYLYSHCSYEGEEDNIEGVEDGGAGSVDGSSSSSLIGGSIEGNTLVAAAAVAEVAAAVAGGEGGKRRRGVLGRPLSAAAMSLLHTRYHSVPKLELIAPLAAKW